MLTNGSHLPKGSCNKKRNAQSCWFSYDEMFVRPFGQHKLAFAQLSHNDGTLVSVLSFLRALPDGGRIGPSRVGVAVAIMQ